MKRIDLYRRCFSALLVLMMLFSGCSGQQKATGDTTERGNTGDITETSGDSFREPIPEGALRLSEYTVVRAADASEDVVRLTTQLRHYFNEVCGINLPVKTDRSDPGEKEIIIGRTSREASGMVYDELRERDWAVRMHDGNLVIAAGSDSLLYLAIDWFKSNSLQESKPYAMVGEGKLFSASYQFSTMTLNGTPIEEVRIAYSAFDNPSFIDSAYMLAYDIMDRTGIPMEVGIYRENSGGRQILVGSALATGKYLPEGVQLAAGQYTVNATGGDILIISDTAIGAELGVQKLISAYKAAQSDAVELTEYCSGEIQTVHFSDDRLELAEGATSRIMTFNIWRVTYDGSSDDGQTDRGRLEHSKDALLYYSPDIVGFQEYCQVYTQEFTPWLEKNGYTVLGNELVKYSDDPRTFYDESQNYTPIAFRSDRYELVASGWQRLKGTYRDNNATAQYTSYYPGHNITWCVLKEKSTGRLVGASSMHSYHHNVWSGANALRAQNSAELCKLIGELTAEYGCAFVAFGDFNSTAQTEAYSVMQNSGIVTDARYVAQKEFCNNGALHTPGSCIPMAGSTTIDHMFVSSGIEVIRHKMGVNQTTSVAADHYPVMIDINLTDISYEDYELTDPDAVTKGAGTSVRVPYRQREE